MKQRTLYGNTALKTEMNKRISNWMKAEDTGSGKTRTLPGT